MSANISSEAKLEAKIGKMLTEHKLTISAAESCTGGLILHRLTNVPGSSVYVMGGFVTYSNEAKIKFAHVNEQTLIEHGAVSEQTAAEMARGARAAFGTDLALSVTGIAGPGGGTAAKPVGLTYIGLSAEGTIGQGATEQGTKEYSQVKRYIWKGDRETVKAQSAQAALEMLLDYLIVKW